MISSWLGSILPGFSSALPLVAAALCFTAPLVLFYCKHQAQAQEEDETIPLAPSHLPVLGHALAYQKSPPTFLAKSQVAVGPLFRINLAGRRMVIVGAHPELQRQIALQPESTLSLNEAVAQIGFSYTLGSHNVSIGTEFHKKLLKNTIYQDWNAFCQQASQQTTLAFAKEIKLIDLFAPKQYDEDARDSMHIHIPDVFQLARITILRAILAIFCGTCFVQDENLLLLKEIMELERKIEVATASAAVLPRWIANRFVLSPTRKFRIKVEQKIAKIIEAARKLKSSKDTASGAAYYGPWLVAMDEQKMDMSVMAELVVGLIFAAHKNPAIGAAQSFCHLWDHQDMTVDNQKDNSGGGGGSLMNRAFRESLELRKQKTLTFDQLQDMAPTLRACVQESTRITAHSLGSLRTVCEEVEIGDGKGNKYKLYPGETVSSSHYLFNVDSKLFPEQLNQYRPDIILEREKAKNSATTTQPQTALTFSGGTHKCPGERIAMIFMQLILALLLERDASVVGKMPPVCFERATLAQRKGPVPIQLLRRRRLAKQSHNVEIIAQKED